MLNEVSLRHALELVNASSFPTTENDSTLSWLQYRQQFLVSLLMQDLISKDCALSILDISVDQLPEIPLLYNFPDDFRDTLLQTLDPEHIESWIEQLSSAQGNGASILHAFNVALSQWLKDQNTAVISIFCSAIFRQTRCLAYFYLYLDFDVTLYRLEKMLDDWSFDDDHELQTSYAQFNSILVFIFWVRIILKRVDSFGRPTFARQFISQCGNVTHYSLLEPAKQSLISRWIGALYGSDGLSDDLLKDTPPKVWLEISTTIYSHSVIAIKQGKLNLDTLKEGIQYLSQPFLEASLLGIIRWTLNTLKTITSETDEFLYAKLLHSLLQPILQAESNELTEFLSGQSSQAKPIPCIILALIKPEIKDIKFGPLATQEVEALTQSMQQYEASLDSNQSLELLPSPLQDRSVVLRLFRESISSLSAFSLSVNSTVSSNKSELTVPSISIETMRQMVLIYSPQTTVAVILNEVNVGLKNGLREYVKLVAAFLLTLKFRSAGMESMDLRDTFLSMAPMISESGYVPKLKPALSQFVGSPDPISVLHDLEQIVTSNEVVDTPKRVKIET